MNGRVMVGLSCRRWDGSARMVDRGCHSFSRSRQRRTRWCGLADEPTCSCARIAYIEREWKLERLRGGDVKEDMDMGEGEVQIGTECACTHRLSTRITNGGHQVSQADVLWNSPGVAP